MKTTIEKLPGDTEGVSYELTVFRFKGTSRKAPTAYIQAALHAGELARRRRRRRADAEAAAPPRRKAASAAGITIVPAGEPGCGPGAISFRRGARAASIWAPAPISTATSRCSTGRTAGALAAVAGRLDRRRSASSNGCSASFRMGHDIVLDLHCDVEGVAYLYAPQAQLWPAMQDCAAALGVGGGAPLGRANRARPSRRRALHPWLQVRAAGKARPRPHAWSPRSNIGACATSRLLMRNPTRRASTGCSASGASSPTRRQRNQGNSPASPLPSAMSR